MVRASHVISGCVRQARAPSQRHKCCCCPVRLANTWSLRVHLCCPVRSRNASMVRKDHCPGSVHSSTCVWKRNRLDLQQEHKDRQGRRWVQTAANEIHLLAHVNEWEHPLERRTRFSIGGDKRRTPDDLRERSLVAYCACPHGCR
jgi:hypothetical protein